MVMPPFAEVENFVQAQVVVKQLAFVNQQSGVTVSFNDRVNDLIKGHDFVIEIRIVKSQRQKRAGQCAGYGDLYF